MKLGLSAAALFAATALATPASALSINLNDIGGVTGTQAEYGFRAAARYWESVITNNAVLNFNVGFSDLGPNVLGGTSNALRIFTTESIEARIAAFGSNSAVDVQVRSATGMPALGPGVDGLGALEVVTPGYAHDDVGIDNAGAVLDNDGSFNNEAIAITRANAKALGIAPFSSTADATIQFSSTFAFDFSPGNGIDAGEYDFIGVAIHEMGHALGFVSGADDYDFLGCPNGPACPDLDDYPVNDDWWGYTMDLFRYSTEFDGQARLDWRPGVEAYFSIDRGVSVLNGNGNFSTGSFHGDGWQASHWKAPTQAPFCTGLVGSMNPYLCSQRNTIVTGTDLMAMDAIGWNLRAAAQGGDYAFSTANLSVPEPTTWAILVLGFGGLGAMLRRRRTVLA